ncbi:restriction endonuclease subunit S [Ktedonobacter robiniae]|uniref:Type I restriction modification DNA specificity domain-containing protein n=1 Tax=Ktedonobacter robiniae TaxID=2778365 RepID=A0ABQ3UPW1_9CHLR|nr:restriction endonuclease subunit S [Ktedonobacter robiniae]GHO54779.1 hypothetical protein KSB_32540 [Ktedonobacter robiniae]
MLVSKSVAADSAGELSNTSQVSNKKRDAYPLHWTEAKLEQISNIVMGQSPSSETYNKSGQGLPFLQGKADFTDLYPIPSTYCTNPLRIAEQGSTLVSVRAPVGSCNLADQNYIIGRGLAAIRLKYGDDRFLFYLFLHKQKDIKALGSGTIFESINKATLTDLSVVIPPLPEQRAIARVLQSAQDTIQARLKELELERERKAALMQYLFTYGTRDELTKQTDIGEAPASWNVVKLGQLCNSSAFGPRFSSTCYDANGNIATLRTTDLDDDGNINYETMPFAQLDTDAFEEHFLQAGDLVITRSGTCGIASVFTAFSKPVLPGAFLIRFRLSLQIDPVFLKYYLNSSMGRKRVLQLATGAIQKNLTGTSLRMLDIFLPSKSEQAEIVNILQTCDSKIKALENEIALHEELFRALLDELMTGKLSALPLVE